MEWEWKKKSNEKVKKSEWDKNLNKDKEVKDDWHTEIALHDNVKSRHLDIASTRKGIEHHRTVISLVLVDDVGTRNL